MRQWKEIEGYEGLYEVSDDGVVRSTLNGRNRELRPSGDGNGYLRVTLCKEGKHKPVKIHRLVASAFIERDSYRDVVNHINGIKSDNRVENLEWVTTAENVQHAFDTGLRSGDFKKSPCIATAIDGKEELWFGSIGDTAMSGFCPSTVSLCCTGKRKEHRGYTWRYAEKKGE